jgi:drug/metabolite transporter (DMT)-like permease
MQQRTLGFVFVVLAATLFGSLGIFGRVATTIDMTMASLLIPRFVAATAILWGYVLATRELDSVDRQLFSREIGLGIVYGAMSIAYFESLVWLSAGIAVLLLVTYPVQVTIGSALFLGERVTLPKYVALGAAVFGVTLLVGGGRVEFAVAGIALVFVASLCYTVYTMGTRIMMETIDPMVHVASVFLGATGTVVVYGVVTDSLAVPATQTGWRLIVGVTVLGTLAPMVLFTEGLARIEASTASIVSTMEPLTTVVLGIVLLGEAVTLWIGLGALLVFSGAVLTAPPTERVTRQQRLRAGTRAPEDT